MLPLSKITLTIGGYIAYLCEIHLLKNIVDANMSVVSMELQPPETKYIMLKLHKEWFLFKSLAPSKL